jgi:hypothetical protein
LLFFVRDHAPPLVLLKENSENVIASMMVFYRLWPELIAASGRRSCAASHAPKREVGKARARTREFVASGLKSLVITHSSKREVFKRSELIRGCFVTSRKRSRATGYAPKKGSPGMEVELYLLASFPFSLPSCSPLHP